MRTEKQIAASRANGAKSKGPATEQGKAKSSQNATKHGLFSSTIVLKTESKAGWDDHCRGLLDRYDPEDQVERHTVYELAATMWRRERAEMIEAQILQMEIDVITATEPPVTSVVGEMRKVAAAYEKALDRSKGLITIQREIARLSRTTDRLMERLDKLQANRPQRDPDPEPEPEIANDENEPETPVTHQPVRTENRGNEPETAATHAEILNENRRN